MPRRLALIFGLFLASTACNGSSGSTSTSQSTGLLNGTFSASIAGTAWTATGRVGVQRIENNSLVIAGVSSTYGITLTLVGATGPGTYVFTDSLTSSDATVTNTNGSTWTTLTHGNGGVILTVLTTSRVAGTFSFPALAPGSTTNTINIANGTFDVTY